jgi:hypothetical protein
MKKSTWSNYFTWISGFSSEVDRPYSFTKSEEKSVLEMDRVLITAYSKPRMQCSIFFGTEKHRSHQSAVKPLLAPRSSSTKGITAPRKLTFIGYT